MKFDIESIRFRFRVPLAVVDAADPRRYRLGILFDEAVPTEAVFERHLHIPNVLATRGWNLLRISSREWDTNRDQVVTAIRAALGDAAPAAAAAVG